MGVFEQLDALFDRKNLKTADLPSLAQGIRDILRDANANDPQVMTARLLEQIFIVHEGEPYGWDLAASWIYNIGHTLSSIGYQMSVGKP